MVAVTKGLGAGANPELAAITGLMGFDAIGRRWNADMVFIMLLWLGGLESTRRTGAMKIGILTVAVRSFNFDGARDRYGFESTEITELSRL